MAGKKAETVWKPEHKTPNKDWAIESSLMDTCRKPTIGNEAALAACLKAIKPCKELLQNTYQYSYRTPTNWSWGLTHKDAAAYEQCTSNYLPVAAKPRERN